MQEFNEEFSKILMKNNLSYCNLEIDGIVLENIVGVMGVEGAASNPKADIGFISMIDAKKQTTKMVGFTSLKDGTNVKNFQQWGGFSKLAKSDKDDDSIISKLAKSDKDEIDLFVSKVKKYLKSKNLTGVPEKEMIWSEIKSNSLKNKLAWGLKYGNGNYNVENVQFIMQGFPRLTEIKNNNKVHVKLEVSHLITRDNNEIEKNTDYRPIFCALFRNDRNDFGLNKTRVFAYAYGGRKRITNLSN